MEDPEAQDHISIAVSSLLQESEFLGRELGLKPIHTYAQTRFLRAVGRIARMPTTRLSRQLLGAWIPDAVRHLTRLQPTPAPRKVLGSDLPSRYSTHPAAVDCQQGDVRAPVPTVTRLGHLALAQHLIASTSDTTKKVRQVWHQLTQVHPVLRDHTDTTKAYLKQRP